MNPSSVQLTFPCPACGHYMTLRTLRAEGPCPTCGATLNVALSVSAGESTKRSLTEPSEDFDGIPRKFNERRFRPVLRPQAPPANQ